MEGSSACAAATLPCKLSSATIALFLAEARFAILGHATAHMYPIVRVRAKQVNETIILRNLNYCAELLRVSCPCTFTEFVSFVDESYQARRRVVHLGAVSGHVVPDCFGSSLIKKMCDRLTAGHTFICGGIQCADFARCLHSLWRDRFQFLLRYLGVEAVWIVVPHVPVVVDGAPCVA